MKNTILFTLLCVLLVQFSCSRSYYSEDAKARTFEHTAIVVLPPKIIIEPRDQDPQLLQKQEKIEANFLQQAMYEWMRKRQEEHNMFIDVNIIEIEQINNQLGKIASYKDGEIDVKKISTSFNADALLQSEYTLKWPLLKKEAEDHNLRTGGLLSGNKIEYCLSIYDKKTQKVLWKYEGKYKVQPGFSTTAVVESTQNEYMTLLMKELTRNMPYYFKEKINYSVK